ncbi:hypothetical protein FOI67_07940 [Geobacillus sp. LEMMJ02]|nr:hypothetical protein FOI67_07940 [Geobacillus sp. LEMMJ02]
MIQKYYKPTASLRPSFCDRTRGSHTASKREVPRPCTKVKIDAAETVSAMKKMILGAITLSGVVRSPDSRSNTREKLQMVKLQIASI